MTKGQEHALENYWPVMGVEFAKICWISLRFLAVKRR